MADRINISLDDTAQALWEKLESEVNNVYDKGGRSEFFRDMLMNYADNKTKLEAKKEVMEDRITALEARLEQLKLEKEGVEARIDKLSVEDEEETDEKLRDVDDEDFWDRTVKIIFTRRSADDPAELEDRYNEWFAGRYQLYCKKFDSLPEESFKEKLMEKAEEKGHEEKVEKLQ